MAEINFMELMHKAYKQTEMSPDDYMREHLCNVFPYSLTFKKLDKKGRGGEE